MRRAEIIRSGLEDAVAGRNERESVYEGGERACRGVTDREGSMSKVK